MWEVQNECTVKLSRSQIWQALFFKFITNCRYLALSFLLCQSTIPGQRGCHLCVSLTQLILGQAHQTANCPGLLQDVTKKRMRPKNAPAVQDVVKLPRYRFVDVCSAPNKNNFYGSALISTCDTFSRFFARTNVFEKLKFETSLKRILKPETKKKKLRLKNDLASFFSFI